MSRAKVGGVWLYKALYNDDDSEELTRKELVEHIDGVDHCDSERESMMKVMTVNTKYNLMNL